jgi:hypothetical protein
MACPISVASLTEALPCTLCGAAVAVHHLQNSPHPSHLALTHAVPLSPQFSSLLAWVHLCHSFLFVGCISEVILFSRSLSVSVMKFNTSMMCTCDTFHTAKLCYPWIQHASNHRSKVFLKLCLDWTQKDFCSSFPRQHSTPTVFIAFALRLVLQRMSRWFTIPGKGGQLCGSITPLYTRDLSIPQLWGLPVLITVVIVHWLRKIRVLICFRPSLCALDLALSLPLRSSEQIICILN